MERNSPSVSPHTSDDERDATGADDPGDGGEASDDAGDAEHDDCSFFHKSIF